MTGRPLHALLLPPADAAGPVLDALAAALDGSGPAILPLDPRLPSARVAALLEAFVPAAVQTPGGSQRWRPASHRPRPGHGRDGTVPPEVAVVIATSGSTGEPKGVQLPAAALLHSARASLDRIGAGPGERWLCPLPVSHVAGLGVLVRSLVAGTTPVVTRRLDPARVDPARLGCTRVSLVPTQLRRLLAAGVDLTGFGTILLGGAAAPAGLLAAAQRAGARVVTTYGMSETCGGCVYDGIPLPGVAVRTAAAGMAGTGAAGTGAAGTGAAGTGGAGRIEISGPVLFAGYRLRPDLTASALADGWFATSDVGSLDGTGRLSVHGRADEMINTGGEKVAPGEVAAELEGCPGVREAVVIGEPDPEWGERVTAIVVPADPASPPALAALRAAVAQAMPQYAAPRAMVLVPEVPLLPSGKPDVAALRTLAAQHAQAAAQGRDRVSEG